MSSRLRQLKIDKSKDDQEFQGIQALLPKENIISSYRNAIVKFDISQLKLPDEAFTESVILFPGNGTYLPRPAKMEGKSVTATTPDEVESGFVILLLQDNISSTTKIINQETETKLEKDLCICKSARTILPVYTKPRTVIVGYLTLTCPACTINCPNGALSADPTGDCYVDPQLCLGQTFIIDRDHTHAIDGREVFNKLSESQCWNCFNINETVSTKCNLRRLRKVAYIASDCCGGCDPRSRVQGLNLMYLCPYGAISNISDTDATFVIHNDLCTGCMICYMNIVCYNNFSYPSNSNITLKMVPFSDNGKSRYYFTINSIQLFDPSYPSRHPINLPASVTLLVKSDIGENSLRLTLNPRHSVSISPADNKTGIKRRLSLALVLNDSLHPHLIQPGGQVVPLPVQSVIFPPFCHDGTISLAGETIKIHYSIRE